MNKKINVILSAKETGEFLVEKNDIEMYFNEDKENSIINIYDDIEFQRIEGFGGAFCESGAYVYNQMPDEVKKEFIDSYFSNNGHNYTICRTHMNSCDFSLDNYSCDDIAGDTDLKSFNIERDHKYLLPMIKDAYKIKKDIRFLISPWSPPAWMKSNNEMNNGGKLLPQYAETWARYFSKFIKMYRSEGVKIEYVSVQNEAKAKQIWDSCEYTAEEEKDFVKYYLGPVLESEGLGDVKIIIWDHNKERLYDRSKVAFDDVDASKYIHGVGFHWYSGDHFEAIELVHKKWPDKFLWYTECTIIGGPSWGDWSRGEIYAHDILGNLNSGANAWTDWTLLLDERGGPNHVNNYCGCAVHYDNRRKSLHYESSYYYIGHFSRYITPGSVRIGCTKYTDKLECGAFKRPDGKIAVIVLNRTCEAMPVIFRLGNYMADWKSPAHSLATIII